MSAVTGSDVRRDGSVRIWALGTGSLLFPPLEPAHEVHSAALSRDGTVFVTVSSKRHTEDELHTLLAQTFPGGASAEIQTTLREMAEKIDPLSEVRLFDASTGAPLTSVVLKVGEHPDIWSSPDGAFILSGSASTLGLGSSGGRLC